MSVFPLKNAGRRWLGWSSDQSEGIAMRCSGATRSIVLGCFVVFSVSSCFERPPEAKQHQPGQYMGRTDPLLSVAGTEEHNVKLQERLNQIQTDR